MSRSFPTHNPQKYKFHELEVGESRTYVGPIHTIRSAASMYGTRNGIWLRVTKNQEGVVVTRVETPPSWKVRRRQKLSPQMEQIAALLKTILSTIRASDHSDEILASLHSLHLQLKHVDAKAQACVVQIAELRKERSKT